MDLTNFDGDDDTQGPGEAALSYNIRKEGDLRRRATRGRPPSIAASGNQWQGRELPAIPSMPTMPSLPENSSPPPMPMGYSESTTTLGKPRSKTIGDDLESAALLFDSGESHPPVPAYPPDLKSPPPHSHSYPPCQSNIQVGKGLQKQLGDEAQAMSILSMFALPGRAPLDEIISTEIHRSKGRIAVTTCGPASLDVLVRKTVAAKIQPGLLRNGDLRGSVTLIAEEFDY
jgi:hypothetical protein